MALPSTAAQQQSQHFLLKWNNHRSNMVSVFENLLHGENLVDVTLAVEGKFLKAHKIVLSACSPYFQAMFVSQTPNEKHPILIFHDLKFNHLKTLLEFMYRGEISIDERDLSEILRVAEALSIRGLSSFESDDEDSSSEQQQKVKVENNNAGNNGGNNNNPSSQTHSPSACVNPATNTNQSQSQNFDNHFQASPGSPSCDSKNAVVAAKTKTTKTKKMARVAAEAATKHGVPPLKRKRGRQPLNKNLAVATAIGANSASDRSKQSKVQPRNLEGKHPPVPRQGVRRRLPKKYTQIKQERISTLSDGDSELIIDFPGGEYSESDAQNGNGSPPNLPDLSSSEPLSEMSVRGLDLFKYASVEDGVYRCMECEKLRIPKTFKNKYSFQRHAFLYHEGNMRKVFPCPVCCREFSRPDKMKNHLRSIHQEGGPSNGKATSPGGSDASGRGTPIGIASKLGDQCDY